MLESKKDPILFMVNNRFAVQASPADIPVFRSEFGLLRTFLVNLSYFNLHLRRKKKYNLKKQICEPQEGGRMKKKILCLTGVILILVAFNSCSSKPEEGLLKRYFNAVSLSDATTMSTMALNPIKIDFESWEIVNVSEEEVTAAKLAELNQKEMELKKAVEDSVGITYDKGVELDDAKFEYENARSAAAKRQASAKVNQLEEAYREQRDKHNEVQKEYNEAKNAAAKEEEMTLFSLGAGDLPTVREFTGDVHKKTVDVKIKTKAGETKTYRFHIRRDNLRDEGLGLDRRGRWVIVRIELLS
jgi:hypothetical protein